MGKLKQIIIDTPFEDMTDPRNFTALEDLVDELIDVTGTISEHFTDSQLMTKTTELESVSSVMKTVAKRARKALGK